MNDSTPPAHETKTSPVQTRPSDGVRRIGFGRTFVLWLIAGLLLGAIGTLFALRWQYADPTPEVTPADYHAAKEKWKANAVENYDLEVQISGTQGATYRVQVREGQAIAAWRNDLPLRQQRTFSTWSVPGMFGTMSRDIEVLEKHATGKADALTPRLTLRAEFDAKYGYPARYRRIEWGSPVQMVWQVTKFEAK
ncbi:hypothetical protein ETAA8_27810 [Anatilimnocola aggregata]|uniref:Uncharacterized protein n=1 Tax=Anatilimnocola aggregata TaxID=2528021 RepID=A0A517YC42_9BACT|nr:DUF6174 domain-containing protein [Anatilimnocola aggregata]QDU27692.1 hypothetical protein ETAA8_27810 [Anatilimnocola aggregata]